MADDSSDREKKDGLLGETLKKVFTAGVSAAFLTEESVRAYLADIKLPKEIMNLLLQQANKTKEEISQRVSKEIVGMLQKADLAAEISKFASSHKFKISAEFEITKKPTDGDPASLGSAGASNAGASSSPANPGSTSVGTSSSVSKKQSAE